MLVPRSPLSWCGSSLACCTVVVGLMAVSASSDASRLWDVARTNLRGDPTRLAIKADHDFAALEASIAESALPGSGVNADDVGNWLDVLAAQAATLRSQGHAASHPSMAMLASDLDRAVEQARPLAAGVSDPGKALALVGILRRIDHKVASAAVTADAEAGQVVLQDQEAIRGSHNAFTYLIDVLLGCVVGLLGIMTIACAGIGRAARRLKAMALGLEAARDHSVHQAERLQVALDNTGRGLCMTDADGTVVLWNGVLDGMLGDGRALRGGTLDALSVGDGDMAPAFAMAAAGRAGVVELKDGRCVTVAASRMANGGLVSTFEDVTEKNRSDKLIAHLAHHDDMTGLVNRRRFDAILTGMIDEGAGIAMLSIDLDGFKEVNDTYGHPAGDAVLREVAWRIRDEAGDGDVVARLGGDEFAVIRPVGDDDGTAFAARIVEVVSRPILTAFGEITLGASIGIAASPMDGSTASALSKSADVALYAAKQAGKGGVFRYDLCADEERRERRSLAQDLRHAVTRGELILHYQPIVEAGTDRVILREALVRWRHPVRGLIPPDSFIPLAEETGDIVGMGAWILQEACRAASGWTDGIGVAVNISALQFASDDLVGTVRSALRRSGLDPIRLELEMTEGVLLRDTVETLRTLAALREIGTRLALDDFGTGYASMSYLQRFSFDKIKIDQSFVRDIVRKGASSHIVASMAELAGQLSLTTCAEGVETLAQADLLASLGCQQLQGFYFGRPVAMGDEARAVTEVALAA